jgi:hypothetical protein
MGAPFGGAQKAELSAVCKLPPSAFGTFPPQTEEGKSVTCRGAGFVASPAGGGSCPEG